MSKETKVGLVLKQANKLKNKKLARAMRITALHSILKPAEEYGILQNSRGT